MANASSHSIDGASVVITHRVHGDKHDEYERWLEEITPLCRASAGYLDWHIVRPVPGVTQTYTVIIRFDTTAHLEGWMRSEARARLIEKVRPLFVGADDFYISSGLDFWFTPAGARAKLPVRWKQYLLTWSAIYPLALAVPLAVQHPTAISLFAARLHMCYWRCRRRGGSRGSRLFNELSQLRCKF